MSSRMSVKPSLRERISRPPAGEGATALASEAASARCAGLFDALSSTWGHFMVRLCLRACLLSLGLTGCNGAGGSAESGARQVIQRWATAFHESDVETIVGLYAPDAVFFGTGSKTLVTAPAEIR